MDIAERIKALIKEKGVTNKEVEKSTGLSNGSISTWTNGRCNPSSDGIVKLSRYFDVSSDYLLCLSDSRRNIPNQLTEGEQLLLDTFRDCSETDKYKLMHYCMTLQEQKGLQENVG